VCRAQLERAIGARHVLHDGVPVPLAVGDRHQMWKTAEGSGGKDSGRVFAMGPL
jgi:hypothetical protein